MKPRVVLLEFNELTPALVERFIGQGRLPNFKRFRGESLVFLTEAAERPPFLEPWIQWVTVHSGLNQAEHGLFHLNEGHKLQAKRIWDLLSDAGHQVWVCGSMNARYEPGLKGCLVPDPWSTLVPPVPDELTTYFKFVQKNVLEYSNDRVPLTRLDYFQFARFVVSHGLSLSTVKGVVRQLASERGGRNRWRRAAILDKLQFDVFRWYYRETRADFSTFFLNSTAHFQHSYWRNMEPKLFTVKPSKDEQSEYASAILFGYEEMDVLLGRFMDLAGRDTTLIFCTALSQQPCLKYEIQGGAIFHRPRDFSAVASFAGITASHTVAPVMTHQFHLDFSGEDAARDAELKLRAVRVPTGQVLQVERTGARIFTGCQLYTGVPDGTQMIAEGTDQRVPFFDLFYRLEAMKSGMHHPDGMLWVRTPARRHSVAKDGVPLAALAPTILEMFDVPRPEHMRAEPLPLRGLVEAAPQRLGGRAG